MVQLRSSRFLSCFYCGKRTAIKKDGLTRNFTCPNCDADNYLDKNGEITDPPVARTSSSRNDRYTSSLPDPFAASSASEVSVFCQTCLKNQRLFAASIAQYEPPMRLDARAAEKHYFSYRRQMESTYPQVCSDCSAAVNQKIREARYTAQTDHLRRMREQTRMNDGGGKGYSALQSLSRAGCWIWWGGWIMQGLWHLVVAARAWQATGVGLTDPDDGSWIAVISPGIEKCLSLVPADKVLRSSMWLAWIGSWWNPYFVQANRGFTRHLSGFGQWYAFQALIAMLRTFLRPFLELQQHSSVEGSGQQAVLAGHLAALVLSALICRLALRSITVDTRPLFGPGSQALSSITPRTEATPPKTTSSPGGFAATLHQALDEPASNAVPSPPGEFKTKTLDQASAPIFFRRETALEEYPDTTDDMDWQPTSSQHRAFQPSTAFPSSQPRAAFGESPTTSEASPFWYKAPAAPQHLNHRLRNAPNVHFVTRSSSQRSRATGSSQENNGVAFRGMEGTFGISSSEESPGKGGMAPPRFFAKERGGEEADGLADLLGSKFGLGDGSPVRNRKAQAKKGGIFGAAPHPPDSHSANQSKGNTDFIGVGAFIVLWLSWMGITSIPESIPYLSQAKAGVLGMATAWNIWCLGSRCEGYMNGAIIGRMSVVLMLFRAVGIAAAAWVLLNLIKEQDMDGWAGGVLCLMLSHQVLENGVL